MTPNRKIGIGALVLGAVTAGGITLTTIGNASAATSAPPTTTVSDGSDSSTTATDAAGDQQSGPHSANGITEEVLSGDTAASVEAAVKAAYPDATIERMETDAEGSAYEAHVTLADGSRATVKLDAAFTVTATQTDEGGPGGHGGRGGGGPHSANGITEEELSGDAAASVEAAVKAAYPDATIERMETDAEGSAYEAHVTLADGTRTTVKLDASFAVTGTSETG